MTPIVLQRADFFELQTLMLRAENAQLVLNAAKLAAQVKLLSLGADRDQPYRLDEATCALMPVNG